MIKASNTALFTYDDLDNETSLFVQDKAQAIRTRLKRTAEDVIAIGLDLIEVKARLGHGHFQEWIQFEFEMNARSAQRFMQVAERFGDKNDNLSYLPISALYELAAPSTPDAIIQMVESGDIPATLPAIREAKEQLREPTKITNEPPLIVQSLTSLGDIFPGFDEWQKQRTPLPESWKLPPELRASAERDRYMTAVDTGTLESYHTDLRREAFRRDEEERAKEKRDAHVMRVMGSSDSPEWYTPREIVQAVCQLLGEIDLDPCSNSHEDPSVPARVLYTKEDDGLSQDWTGRMYLNPPYGNEIPAWVNKMVASYKNGKVEEAVALLPGRIDTVWFQPLYEYLICNVRGRVQYENSPYHAPFPCVIVYLGKREQAFIEQFGQLGPIMRRVG